MNGTLGELFRTTTGVRQGCRLSPTLFNILLERIMNDALGDHVDRTVTHFCFADDIDGLAGDEQELVNLVSHLDKASACYGMEISAEKTKLINNDINGINKKINDSISYKDHVASEEVLTTVKRRKLKWYGHVSRTSSLTKTFVQCTVRGARRRGRQSKRWEDNMRESGQAFSDTKGGRRQTEVETAGCEVIRGAPTCQGWRPLEGASLLICQLFTSFFDTRKIKCQQCHYTVHLSTYSDTNDKVTCPRQHMLYNKWSFKQHGQSHYDDVVQNMTFLMQTSHRGSH
ncbi:hypothetical protein LSAT2_018860 [Lamellibrachia satsuma]|nr:hypothetical protein LSAT2_018860 [Lamellibrachia satsuma]